MEQKILSALEGHNLSTWLVAKKLKVHTPTALKILKKMETAGKVKRHRLSACNNIVWMAA